MGCLITSGRKVPCKSAVGGIKTIYFADYGTLGDVTIVAGEITAVTGAVEFFQFDVKGNSSMELLSLQAEKTEQLSMILH